MTWYGFWGKSVVALESQELIPHGELASTAHAVHHRRVHEALDNLTPADVYQGRAVEITTARDLVKEQTLRGGRRLNLGLMPMNKGLIRPEDLREAVL